MFDFSRFLFLEQMPIRVCKNPYRQFVPDFTNENELFRSDNEPINIVDSSKVTPFIQNVAQQQLVEVSSDSLDTSGLSDSQLADTVIPRYAEISDLEDISNSNLSQLSKEREV